MATIETQQWTVVPSTEGTLARQWERRLRPKTRKVARRKRPWVGTVAWIGLLWTLGLGSALLATRVMIVGYQLDALNTQYQQVVRQHQSLEATLIQKTSSTSLIADSQQLKTTVTAPPQYTPQKTTAAIKEAGPWWSRISDLLKGMRQAWMGG